MADWRPFTHTENDSQDWSRLYPYTIIGYQLGKRIYPEITDVREVVEQIKDAQSYAPNKVISPNGLVWTPEKFVEQYEVIVGLLVL